jgi:cytochrome c553
MRFSSMLTVAALLLAGSAHANGDPTRGQEISKTCQACHGADGNGVGDPQYPILAGQYPDYLAVALKAYRAKTRENVIMQGFATTLSDKDIHDLAAYFGAQTSKITDLSHQ